MLVAADEVMPQAQWLYDTVHEMQSAGGDLGHFLFNYYCRDRNEGAGDDEIRTQMCECCGDDQGHDSRRWAAYRAYRHSL